MSEDILVLEGEAAKDFLEYDQRELTEDEKKTLREAREIYKKYCKV
ncbi:MAG: hypothetical protein KGI27_12440 [Thaumarchaeota archaeon]|nr:hypothetical protein [Nitrososphaerota archaeon]